MSHDMFTTASEHDHPGDMRTWKDLWVQRWEKDKELCRFRDERGICRPGNCPCTMETCEFARRGLIDGME